MSGEQLALVAVSSGGSAACVLYTYHFLNAKRYGVLALPFMFFSMLFATIGIYIAYITGGEVSAGLKMSMRLLAVVATAIAVYGLWRALSALRDMRGVDNV